MDPASDAASPKPQAPARPRRGRKLRIAAAIGAVVAATVATIFATVGDGVDATAPGIAGMILEHGHTATWVLLAAAFALTAIDIGPKKLPGWIAYAGLACYGAFMLTLWMSGR